MAISDVYEGQRRIALGEFGDIVSVAEILRLETGEPRKLRLGIADGTFVDVFVSVSGRYSYHWERDTAYGQEVYRHDNAPHSAWRGVSTFPSHFHLGTERNVVASHLSGDPHTALREFLHFVRLKLFDRPTIQ